MSILKRVLRRIARMMGRRPPARRVVRLEDVTYNDTPNLERFIFIGGLHRSGTTMLERLLATRFELSYLRASVPESEGQHMQSVYRVARKYGGPGRFAFIKAMRDELPDLAQAEAYRAQIVSEWNRFVVGDSTTLLEKSPANMTKIDWLRQVFPNSRFIIMTRDPRAAAGATQKWAGTSLPELMMHWNAAYSQTMADFRDTDCIITRYEDLTENSEAEIARLAEFLDLVPRAQPEELEERYANLSNSNDRYFDMHEGAIYGDGIWKRFGYDF